MRITKPVALGAAGWKRHTGSLPINLQATRSNAAAARSPITLFAGDTRARFIARLFTFGQRCDRLDCWIQSTTDRYRPRFPWCIRSISLVKNCTNFLFLPCFIFCFFCPCLVCCHFFYLDSFCFTRRDTGRRGWLRWKFACVWWKSNGKINLLKKYMLDDSDCVAVEIGGVFKMLYYNKWKILFINETGNHGKVPNN